ncbi:MAG: restriction endonuclease subunit S [Candidatus Kapabacteria bacterium]|nr:restriction endonuclease subunit S [Candidatus Kapabacteria bacterium]
MDFDFSERHYASSDFVLDERKLQKGDILINSTGVGTAGRVTLFNLDGDFVVDSHITIFRPNEKVLPKYALYSLANIGFDTIEKMANGSSGQIELSLSTIENISFLIPPLSTQHKIVAEIEGYEAEIAKAKTIMDGCAARKQEILSRIIQN